MRIRKSQLALHLPDLLDDLGISQRRDVAGLLGVRDCCQHPAHKLAGTGLRHVRQHNHAARTGTRTDLAYDGILDMLADVFTRLVTRLERNIEVWDLALDLISRWNDCRFRDLFD